MPVPNTLNARGVLTAAVALLLPFSAMAEGRYIVQFRNAEKGKAAVAAAGAKVVKELLPQNAAAAHIPDHALNGLRNNPHIEFIEEDPIRVPLAQSVPYGIDMVQARTAQTNYSISASRRKVCIIDSGLYTGHEDLLGNLAQGYPLQGWNTDKCGHGTHVAGTIAAIANNSVGVVGVLPTPVSLHIVKVFGDDCGWTYASTLVDATNQCAAAGANVINMSLGGGRKSRLEERAFIDLWDRGLISVAAAGNDGTSRMSYPASYASVISVAAVDADKQVAPFSQRNSQVDLAAPGVGVLSTVPWLAETNTLSDGRTIWSGNHIEFAGRGTASGTIVDGKLCDSATQWFGAVVLCQRGNISFLEKVMNVQNGGGSAAVIYNNVAGGFFGTLGNGNSSRIPAISISKEDGESALLSVAQAGTVVSSPTLPGSGYEAWDGTSMATPHVAAVAALVWSYDITWSNQRIRDALVNSALDLGTPGRDDSYGHGLVQAEAALKNLVGSPPSP
jgi:serine protease